MKINKNRGTIVLILAIAVVFGIEIATNSALAERKKNWIDFDAGKVLNRGIETMGDELLALIARIASGEETASERNDEREIAIWKRGVTL